MCASARLPRAARRSRNANSESALAFSPDQTHVQRRASSPRTMSTMASDAAFLSALQPNTSVTTYGLPSDIQVGHGSSMNETAKARRVQQQVQMRLAEKSTLPRQNGSSAQYAMSEHGGSSSVKYQTYNPSFSSKSSYMYSGSRTMGPRVSNRSAFSSQSAAPEMLQFQRMSVGSGGVGGGVGGGVSVSGGGGSGFYREDMRIGNYQGNIRQQSQMDPETLSLHSMRQQTLRMNPWMNDGSDGGSLVSDRDATCSRQYAQNTMNGYTSQVRQGAGTMTFPPPMRRSLSGTLYRGGMAGGEAAIVQQQSFKGPAHRTISRITNRNRMSMGSTSGTLQQQMSLSGSNYGGDQVDRGFIVSGMSGSQGNMGSLSRAISMKSIQSVGRGMDIYSGQTEMGASSGNLIGIDTLDMPSAVQYLREDDQELQVMGAAYIQHECYSNKDAKTEVRRLKGIADLVRLIGSSNTEVQRYATGATRNLIYENMDNKVVLIEEDGIPKLLEALKNTDEEVNKNVTGILWNLSSKDTLKEKLAKEVLVDLTDKVLVPLSGAPDSDNSLTASEADIFQNTTGCLRNLSSVSEKTRQLMRGTNGLVESLVKYVKGTLDSRKVEEKGVENSMCVLRNLSYQLYSEMAQSVIQRLEGPTREKATGKGEAIGCFTPQSRKAKSSKNQDLTTFAEVARVPKGMEWLWHPDIVEMYKNVLQQCEINSTTREAAAGALQNITAGDKRWAGVLSRVALEQQRILPVLVDKLNSSNDAELRSFTGLLRNLSRHAKDKSDLATKLVNHLVEKLPDDQTKGPSNDVVVNICGVLNNLVTSTPVAAREIAYFNGLPKLRAIKESRDTSSAGTKASKAAATVLSNMFLYKKLHKQYSEKGFSKADFVAS